MYEIEASQIAVDRAKSAEVKAFARQMIMDHSKTSQKLEDFVTNNPVNIAIPENMDGRRSAMIENLRKASDDEFDSVYMGQQAAARSEEHTSELQSLRTHSYADFCLNKKTN